MNKKNMMREFINEINNNNKMTKFIKNIFDYEMFYDYNYLFRMIDNDNEIIIDIYDNVSKSRFNRYIFSFVGNGYCLKLTLENDVFISYINISDAIDSDNKLLRLAYLFKIDNCKMINYASSFLDSEFVDILDRILKKPI